MYLVWISLSPSIASVQGPGEIVEGHLINFHDKHQNRPRLEKDMEAPLHLGHRFGMDADLAAHHRQHQVKIEY